MTNKPEVKRWQPVGPDWEACVEPDGDYVTFEDYEALQAEMAEIKQTTLFAAGYRFGRDANDAGHTVRLQKEKDALQAELEMLRAQAEGFTEDERNHLLLALSCLESDLPEHHSLLNKLR